MVINPPFIITPRLLPGYRSGDWCFSVAEDLTIFSDNFKTGETLICKDLKAPQAGGWSFERHLEAFGSFLFAWQEARSYPNSDNRDLFGEEWAQCADDCADDLSMLEYHNEQHEA